MARPRFSEMLSRRRRQLGIDIAQAARVLRLKEQVLIAFEAGDWDNMPKSGYAQGMLASYARYLNLNPRQVTDLFAADLASFQRDSGRDDAILRGPDSTGVHTITPSETRGSERERTYSGARGLLPTSGGYAGDLAGFSTVSRVHSRAFRTGMQDEGERFDRYQSRKTYGLGERPYTTRQPGSSTSAHSSRGYAAHPQGRDEVRVEDFGETRRAPSAESRPTRQRAGYRPRVPIDDTGWTPESRQVRTRQGNVTTRRVSSSDYVDDLNYNDAAHPYKAASTRTGRIGYRNIADAQRPNVQRRQSSDRRAEAYRRERQQRLGLLGSIGSVISGNGQLFVLIGVITTIILTVIIVSSVSTCTANFASNGRKDVVAVSDAAGSGSSATSSPGSSGNTEPSSTNDQQNAGDTTDSTKGASSNSTDDNETKVEVTVAVQDDGTSWVEITLDGQTSVAETKTGPWSETYTVTKAIKIEVSEPSVVTVTRNGKVVSFEKKASGVGTITIEGPKLPETTTSSGQNGAGTSDSTSDSSSGDNAASSGDDGTADTADASSNTDTDATGDSSTSSGDYEVIQYDEDGGWYDQNWYYHDGMGGYYDNDGTYHTE